MSVAAHLPAQHASWLHFRAPWLVAQSEPALVTVEFLFFFLTFLTLAHAFKYKGRALSLWLAAFLHGLVAELLAHSDNAYETSWHAQSSIMLAAQKLPLYIVCMHCVFLYTACMTTARFRLRTWSEPAVVGLAILALDAPLELIGARFLFWTWHQSDPNVWERVDFVPWACLVFHVSSASSFLVALRTCRVLLTCKTHRDHVSGSWVQEALATLLTALLSTPLSILQLLLFYHFPSSQWRLSAKSCTAFMLSLYLVIIWLGEHQRFVPSSFASLSRFEPYVSPAVTPPPPPSTLHPSPPDRTKSPPTLAAPSPPGHRRARSDDVSLHMNHAAYLEVPEHPGAAPPSVHHRRSSELSASSAAPRKPRKPVAGSPMLALKVRSFAPRRVGWRDGPSSMWSDSIYMGVCLYCLVLFVVAVAVQPELTVSVSFHQRVGNCDDVETVSGAPSAAATAGMSYKLSNFCPTDLERMPFTVHCASTPGAGHIDLFDKLEAGQLWYRVCGKPHENAVEFISTTTGLLTWSLLFFTHFLRSNVELSGPDHGPKTLKLH